MSESWGCGGQFEVLGTFDNFLLTVPVRARVLKKPDRKDLCAFWALLPVPILRMIVELLRMKELSHLVGVCRLWNRAEFTSLSSYQFNYVREYGAAKPLYKTRNNAGGRFRTPRRLPEDESYWKILFRRTRKQQKLLTERWPFCSDLGDLVLVSDVLSHYAGPSGLLAEMAKRAGFPCEMWCYAHGRDCFTEIWASLVSTASCVPSSDANAINDCKSGCSGDSSSSSSYSGISILHATTDAIDNSGHRIGPDPRTSSNASVPESCSRCAHDLCLFKYPGGISGLLLPHFAFILRRPDDEYAPGKHQRCQHDWYDVHSDGNRRHYRHRYNRYDVAACRFCLNSGMFSVRNIHSAINLKKVRPWQKFQTVQAPVLEVEVRSRCRSRSPIPGPCTATRLAEFVWRPKMQVSTRDAIVTSPKSCPKFSHLHSSQACRHHALASLPTYSDVFFRRSKQKVLCSAKRRGKTVSRLCLKECGDHVNDYS